jgi:uncharacterized membrane protein
VPSAREAEAVKIKSWRWNSDLLLRGALVVLAVIVAAGILFAPQELPAPSEAAGEALTFSEQKTMEGRVAQILAEEKVDLQGGAQYVQQAEVEITSGPLAGEMVEVEHGGMYLASRSSLLKRGMRVVVERMESPEGDRFYVSSIVRRRPVWVLAVAFAAVTVAIGRWTGARSLAGLAFSVLVLARFVLPRILSGQDPVAVSIIGALVLMAPSLYMVYGWKGKTHAAVLGMSLSLVFTWLLAAVFVSWTHLTGFADESVAFLVVATEVELNPRGLVLAGIILGTLGMLDDIAVSLSSAVFELAGANPGLTWRELFRRSMVIGVDHFASMVNSLMLAYVGASLPLFLLLMIYREPLGFTLNRELFVEEILRTLVGGIGLMLAGPVTSLIACWLVKRGSVGADTTTSEVPEMAQ